MLSMRLTIVEVATLLCAAAPALPQEYRYAVFELPGLTTEGQWAGAVSAATSGATVGYTSSNSHDIHGALWANDSNVSDLGTLGGDDSAAVSIRSGGDIAGWAGFRPGSSIYIRHACIWRNGNIIDLGTLGGESSYASAMNDSGQVVGNSEFEFSNYAERAVLWENGQVIALPGAREGTFGRYANDINEIGQIVGKGSGLDFQYNGLLWHNGEVTDLGSLAGLGSSAYSINDAGVIVGDSITANDRRHAVRWINGQIEDIHTPSAGAFSVARGINNLGQIVGDNSDTFNSRAWVLNPGEPMIYLNYLVPPRLRIAWRMGRATEINDAGQIPVTAYPPGQSADTWALLLSPVQPTMAMAAPAPGIAGADNTITVSEVTPGARVTFLYSRHGGGTRIPGCDLQQNALQLDNPTVIGTATANQNGVATITRPVPLIARGQTILFQAVVQNECAISQLVVWRFE